MTTENTPNPDLDENGFLKSPVIENPTITEIPAPSEAPKKKRGRPPLNKEQIEQGTSAPKTAAGKPRKQKVSISSEQIKMMGNQLVGLHTVAAMATGIGELVISDTEGQALAVSIVAVAEQYDLSIDGKTGAALQLAMTAAMIYAPRFMAIRSKQNQPRSANVVATQ